MTETLLILALAAGLPLAYLHGKRVGFERHTCVHVTPSKDRAPQTYVTVPCPACSLPIDCEIELRRSFNSGVPKISATVDATDFEHHTLTHIDEVQHP